MRTYIIRRAGIQQATYSHAEMIRAVRSGIVWREDELSTDEGATWDQVGKSMFGPYIQSRHSPGGTHIFPVAAPRENSRSGSVTSRENSELIVPESIRAGSFHGNEDAKTVWHLTENGVQEGPFEEQDVAARAANGTVSRNTLVWRDGMREWLPLHQTDLVRLLLKRNPPPAPKSGPNTIGDGVKEAPIDAWRAFRNLIFDPVGNLSSTFESVGQTHALGVGVIFGAVFALCSMFGIYKLVPHWMRPHGATKFLTFFLEALVPFISLTAASALSRIVFRGRGRLGHDFYIAGTSLTPIGFAVLLAGILGAGNIEAIIGFGVFALCLNILLLFAGMSRVCAISERAATVAVPLMLIASAWFSKIIYLTVLKKYLG